MWGEARGKENKSSLAHRAQQKYNAGKYVEAIDALQKLAEEIAPERDSKVQHNLLLAGFVAGHTAPKELEASLRNLLSAVLDAAEKKKAAAAVGDAGADCEAKFAAEREAAFLRYNLAASLFHQKQYAAAGAMLEGVLRKIEPVDERVAMHVCFLYLDVILHSVRGCVTTERERLATLKKAQAVFAYLERPHRFNGQLFEQPGDAPPPPPSDAAAAGVSAETEPQRKARWDATEFRFRLHLYKAKFVLLEANLKTAKKEVKSALEIFQKEIKARDRAVDDSDSGAGVTGATAATWDKTSTAISHPALAVQNSTALFLKANLEYLRKNSKKCVKLLASCSQDAVDESIFLNNMGCIHFQMGQRKAAQSYFSRALEASGRPKKAQVDGVVVTSSSQFEILYNNGVHLLLQGEFGLAFRCFHASSRLFFNRPKLWLRMGECCTAAFAQQQKLAAVAGNKSGLIQGIVGSGSHRRVVLPTCIPSSASQDIELPEKNGKLNHSQHSQANGTPKMNLPFAAKCFKNVVLLCNQLQELAAANGDYAAGASNAADAETGSAAASGMESLDALRQKALVNLSYVYLSMYEPQLAITSAKELLALPSCSRSSRFLARSYAAEALSMLSRAAEATETLQSERDLVAMAEDYAREAKIQPSRARSGVHVNNATTLILQGRMSEAEESVTRAVRENPNCRESLELLVYVLLKKGDTKKAARVLKEAQVAQ